MSTGHQYHLSETIGGVSVMFLSALADLAQQPIYGVTLDISVGVVEGNQAIICTFTVDPNENIRSYQALGVVETAVLPLQVVTSQAGFQTSLVGNFTPIDGYDVDYYIGVLEEMITEGHAPFAEQLTGGTASDIVVDGVETFDGNVMTFSASYVLDTDTEHQTVTIRIVLWSSSYYPVGEYSKSITEYLGAPGVTALSNSGTIAPSLDLLINAVNAITDQDVSISLNYGAVVYSIKAKTVTRL